MAERPQLRPREQRRIVKSLRERDGDNCIWCGQPVRNERPAPRDPLNPSIEHLIPWRVCQSNDLDVLALAHVECNQMAHSRRQRRALRKRLDPALWA